MRRSQLWPALAAAALLSVSAGCGDTDEVLVSSLTTTLLDGQGTGSTIGPDGALYVSKNVDGTVQRVDPATGAATLAGSGLPKRVIEIGGAMDVAFLDGRAYALVSIAGKNAEAPDAVMGVYRLGDDGTFSLFADLGSWSEAHPPVDTDWFLSQGVQYAMTVWDGTLVISDAHLGRLLQVDAAGAINELMAFESTDAVPIGLTVRDGELLVATAGPVPHRPDTSVIRVVADGAMGEEAGRWSTDYEGNLGLLIDIATADDGTLYGLLQGHWDGGEEGSPAAPNTGALVRVDDARHFEVVADHLNQPTSLAISGSTAFVATNVGTLLKVSGL